MKQNKKVGIFYHKNKKPSQREYWIGTYTKDGTTCKNIIEIVAGKGTDSLRVAKQYLKQYLNF